MFRSQENLQKYLVTIKTTDGEKYTAVIEAKNAKSASHDLYIQSITNGFLVVDTSDRYDGDGSITINARNICTVAAEPHKGPYDEKDRWTNRG